MLNVLTAVNSQFTADATLSALFPNGCYLSLAPNNSTLPIAVVNVVNVSPDFYVGSNDIVRTVTVQFDVYDSTDTDALTGLAAIQSVFDFATLNPPTGSSLLCLRGNEGLTRDDEDTWHAFSEYRITIQN